MSNLRKSFVTVLLAIAAVFMLLVSYDYGQISAQGIADTALSRASPYWTFIGMWVFMTLALCAIASIILIWSMPKRYLAVKRQDEDGTLTVNPSAIEGYVKCILAEDAAVYAPKVKVFVKKNTLRVDVNTQVAQNESVIDVARHLEYQLKRDLEDFLGVTQDPEVHVNITTRAPTKTTPRVV